jgi:SWI/SNF related-matrix-associated actin-dependent regulator of chromatin subfamily C
VDPDSRPSVIGPPFTGHFLITADTPRGLQSFQPTTKIEATSGKALASTEKGLSATPLRKSELTMEGRRNIFDRTGKDVIATSSDSQANGEENATNGTANPESVTKAVEGLAKEPKNSVYCVSCGMDCTRARWHNARTSATLGSTAAKEKYDVCSRCFSEGRFPTPHTEADFVLLEDPNYSNVPDRDSPWSEAELLLLLEGLEIFDDNWTSIANHVGSRTREECVLKFLQLEIEDKYVEDEIDSDVYPTLGSGRLPYSQAENPVLSVVGFLAGMNGPNVTATMIDKPVKELVKTQRQQLENGTFGKAFREHSKDKEHVKNEDSMEVDTASSPQAHAGNQAAVFDERGVPTTLSTIALANSAARAATMASHEEREMTRLVAAAVNITLQKFELKLAQFSEMEALIQAERQELERGRQQLFLDRLAFKKRVREVQEGLRKMGVKGGIPEAGEHKLNMFSVSGRAEEDVRPLGANDDAFASFEI